jgi:hypothetical protein
MGSITGFYSLVNLVPQCSNVQIILFAVGKKINKNILQPYYGCGGIRGV